ncbi:MAG: DUF7033 domain-containing protein [Flavobacteriaceae bacterium]|tara:strand:- start:36340 stop:37650 length:1311 start_codon:yes stop_codon:yes gene_type:complete
MILIYCYKGSPRIEYIFNHIFKFILNKQFSITYSKTEFIDYRGYKFSYANAPISDELFFQSIGLLHERGLENYEVKIFKWENVKCFFKVGEKSSIPFDIFSAIFFLLSRYEEYMPHTGNKIGQFNYNESIAYKEEFLEIPLVDIWIEKFKSILENKIKLKCKMVSNNQIKSILISSINPYKYTNKYPFESFLIWFKNLIKLNLWEVIEHFFVFLRIKVDPWEMDDYLKKILLASNKEILFFFSFSSESYFKNETPKTNENFRKYIKEVSDNFEIGLLPSNKALKNPKTFQLESLNISNLVNIKVVKMLFQDGLKKTSQDYKNFLSVENANDFSMGYIDAFGYRASTCSSFFFYDLSNETKTNLLVTPFIAHFKLIDKTSLSKAISKIQKFNEIGKKYYGSFSIILNNEIFENSFKNNKRRFHFASLIKNIDNGFNK